MDCSGQFDDADDDEELLPLNEWRGEGTAEGTLAVNLREQQSRLEQQTQAQIQRRAKQAQPRQRPSPNQPRQMSSQTLTSAFFPVNRGKRKLSAGEAAANLLAKGRKILSTREEKSKSKATLPPSSSPATNSNSNAAATQQKTRDPSSAAGQQAPMLSSIPDLSLPNAQSGASRMGGSLRVPVPRPTQQSQYVAAGAEPMQTAAQALAQRAYFEQLTRTSHQHLAANHHQNELAKNELAAQAILAQHDQQLAMVADNNGRRLQQAGTNVSNTASSFAVHAEPQHQPSGNDGTSTSSSQATGKLLAPPRPSTDGGGATKKKPVSSSSVEKVRKTWAVLESSIQGPVVCACRYVRSELKHGMWPSPFVIGEESPLSNNASAELQHRDHMKLVSAALEQFAYEVLLPAMHRSGEQRTDTDIHKSKTHPHPRIFFATLLGLREVMTQNAEPIFGNECLNQAIEDDDEGTVRVGTSSSSSPRKARILKEEKSYCARSLSTAVIIAAIERSKAGDVNKTIKEFLKVAQAYDDGDADFSSCLKEDPGNVRGVLHNGKRLNAEEEVARNVSFNRARKLHPIVQRDMERRMKMKPKRLIHVPEANACHITLVEKLSDLTRI